jgi:uroporphyrinogen decarboxylase
MLEGRGKQDFSTSKNFIYENFDLAKKLVYLLADNVYIHLSNQLKSGADLVQIFDSWSGMLSGQEYEEFVIKPTSYIVSNLKKEFPDRKIIGFPRGSGYMYENYMKTTGIDAIGVDQFVPIDKMVEWQKKIVVQGNLDPVTLLSNKDTVKRKADEILSKMSGNNFIFNLGHGILPNTKIENVEFLVNYVNEYK